MMRDITAQTLAQGSWLLGMAIAALIGFGAGACYMRGQYRAVVRRLLVKIRALRAIKNPGQKPGAGK